MHSRKNNPYVAVIILLLSFFVYFNSFHNAFHYDDFHHIVENPSIREIGNLPRFFTHTELFSGSPEKGVMYRPVLMASHALNYHFWGLEVTGYHVVNNLIHSLNAVLVFLIATVLLNRHRMRSGESSGETSRSSWSLSIPPLLSGLLFGVHTINTQAVNYISSRSVLLVTLFYLLSFYLYIKARNERERFKYILYYSGAFITYVLSLLSKEIGITLPLMLLVYEYLFHRTGHKGYIRNFVKYQLLFWSPVIGYLLMRKVLFGRAVINLSWGAFWDGAGMTRSLYINILTQVKVMVFYYIKLFLLPVGLSVEHDIAEVSSIGDPTVLLSLVIVVVIIGTAVFVRRKRAIISLGIAWLFITILPETIIPLNLIVNEARTYLPLVGFALAGGYGVDALLALNPRKERKVLITGMALVIITLLGTGTIIRNQTWRDGYSLWSDAVQKAPESFRAHKALAGILYEVGHVDEAILELQKAISIKPQYAAIHTDLGVMYQKVGALKKAIQEYQVAIRLDPGSYKNHSNLGILYLELGWLDMAVEELKIAVRLKPDQGDAYNNLGLAYAKLGMPDKAINTYKEASKQNPDDAAVYSNLGNVYSDLGKFVEAKDAYRTALRINPGYTEVYYNLGLAYAGNGMLDEAIGELNTVIKQKPDYLAAHRTLGSIYHDKGLMPEAIVEYEEVIRLDPTRADVYNDLGIAYARLNSLERAIESFQEALRIDPDYPEAKANLNKAVAHKGLLQ